MQKICCALAALAFAQTVTSRPVLPFTPDFVVFPFSDAPVFLNVATTTSTPADTTKLYDCSDEYGNPMLYDVAMSHIMRADDLCELEAIDDTTVLVQCETCMFQCHGSDLLNRKL